MVRIPYRALLLACLVSMLVPPGLSAQSVVERRLANIDSSYICVLRSEDVDAFIYTPANAVPEALNKASSAKITVSFHDETSTDPWPQKAMDAVNYAAGIWAGIISSQVEIRIEANWTNLGSCDGSQFSLASAGPQYIYRNFSGAPKKDTWYPDALADALIGADQGRGKADITAKFNRSCGPSGSGKWYFGIDGKPPSGTIDMPSVALHEFAHGLGIFGSADVDDGNSSNGTECNGTDGVGCLGTGDGNDPLSYDRFTEAGDGIPLLSLSNPSATLGTALEGGRGGGVYFSGPSLTSAGFSRAKLYAPATFTVGASYAHVDENTYNRTTEALMTPFLARAESIHTPGVLACAILEDIGWNISGQCAQVATTTQPPESVPASFNVEGPYPNPLVDGATLIVSVPSQQSISIDVFDTLGRPVERVFKGMLAAGSPRVFRLDATRLSPGAYIVAISGAFDATSRSMIVAK